MNSQKGFAPIVIILAVVAVIVSGGAASYFFIWKTGETTLPETVQDIKEKLGGGPNISDWQTYTSVQYGFSIKHPVNYETQEGAGSVFFFPPELKDITETPKTLKELPLGVAMPPDQSYDKIRDEIKKQSGVEYSEATAKVIIGIEGIELKRGPTLGSDSKSAGDANLHKLYNFVPYKGGVLIFVTHALSKKQLEGQGTRLLDAFISTFKPE